MDDDRRGALDRSGIRGCAVCRVSCMSGPGRFLYSWSACQNEINCPGPLVFPFVHCDVMPVCIGAANQ